MLYGLQDRQIYQWNTIKSLKTDPHIYEQLIFNKSAREIQWRENMQK